MSGDRTVVGIGVACNADGVGETSGELGGVPTSPGAACAYPLCQTSRNLTILARRVRRRNAAS